MREDSFTIGVRFPLEHGNKILSEKEYTYVCDIKEVVVGSTVLVKANGRPTIAYVTRVDDGVCIEPGQTIKYSWVIDRVDQEEYEKKR